MSWIGNSPLGRRGGGGDDDARPPYVPGDLGADGDGASLRPEVADLGRLGRRLIRKAVRAARADEVPALHRLLAHHLGQGAAALPVVAGKWPSHDHVNLQVGLEHWLGEAGRSHTLIGITRFEHRSVTLADLGQPAPPQFGPGIGSVSMVSLGCGPEGATHPAVRCALYLVSESEGPLAILVREGESHGPSGPQVLVEVTGPDPARASVALAEIRQAALTHNVFRGQVVVFGSELFGPESALLSFQGRPALSRDALVLPPGVLELVEQQVVGIARRREAMTAAGQHLKRGLLLHGPPGTGKTHTVRYLLGQLEGVTAIILSGDALGAIGPACSIARTLQPAVVVVEDVDLIAEHRGMHPGQNPLLFRLLNEMDGLGEDVDVAFVLTTNRADLLEPALAARPGRVDQAVEIPLPDAAGRRRLIELYAGQLVLSVADLAPVVERTEGVTASFLKELVRRASLLAADRDGAAPAQEGHQSEAAIEEPPALVVGPAELDEALDQLLGDGNRLTRVLLGGSPAAGAPTPPSAGGEG
ncbi:MAG TPA: ATP-binding protein [Candidatus Dormibacteraeota bacterium]|nr:ATP-binding protein [Candidatus Dormibacteraeota bacterium]